MRELVDRWILPLAGGAVTQCCINHGLTIEVASNGADAATVFISGAFDLQSADGAWRLNPAGKAVDLAPALVLLGLAVDYAAAHKDGTLEMVFAGGIRLRVPPDEAYEAWEFDGNHGAKAIALPGGDIAIWRSAA
jgi:hypothetical protein